MKARITIKYSGKKSDYLFRFVAIVHFLAVNSLPEKIRTILSLQEVFNNSNSTKC